MPYINQVKRESLSPFLTALADQIETGGELNYAITFLCQYYLSDPGHQQNGTYAAMSEVVGHLECAKLEFYRRVLASYEDTKAVKNGDVYDIHPTNPA